MKDKIVIFWFRRDLRIEDNAGLSKALNSGFPVLPIFIFDKNILDQFEDRKDRRVDYIHQALQNINSKLEGFESTLKTYFDIPLSVFRNIIGEFDVQAVYCNRDYEPKAIERDLEIFGFLETQSIRLKAYKDQVIFDKNDILKRDGTPYTVYSPYAKQWKEKLAKEHYQTYDMNYANFYNLSTEPILELESIGFEKTDMVFYEPNLDVGLIAEYDKNRDFPALQKTTQLGVALRFGTISIRYCVSIALDLNQVWLSELIWREFFMQILYHFPHVVHQSFKAKYDHIKWRNDENDFEMWCKGNTGYAIVDAGMHQLNTTGYMHNRVRMIVASFLCKHLLIDWRWGEAYFAQKLIDYDLSANNGNWQWAAGCGCDAAPYFRVFNPMLQTTKFDKNYVYIKQWLKGFDLTNYSEMMVDHDFARKRALRVYAEALK